MWFEYVIINFNKYLIFIYISKSYIYKLTKKFFRKIGQIPTRWTLGNSYQLTCRKQYLWSLTKGKNKQGEPKDHALFVVHGGNSGNQYRKGQLKESLAVSLERHGGEGRQEKGAEFVGQSSWKESTPLRKSSRNLHRSSLDSSWMLISTCAMQNTTKWDENQLLGKKQLLDYWVVVSKNSSQNLLRAEKYSHSHRMESHHWMHSTFTGDLIFRLI